MLHIFLHTYIYIDVKFKELNILFSNLCLYLLLYYYLYFVINKIKNLYYYGYGKNICI